MVTKNTAFCWRCKPVLQTQMTPAVCAMPSAEQSLRAGQIIRRLRDFVSRGESERRAESIKKLVEEASALALIGAKERGFRVRYPFAPEADLVLVDRVQIQQVLLNLMRNAMEAMEHSERREILLSTTPAADDLLMVNVADTGPGIDDALASQLCQAILSHEHRITLDGAPAEPVGAEAKDLAAKQLAKLATRKAAKKAAKAPEPVVKPAPAPSPPPETAPKTPEQLRDRVRAALLRRSA
jgi:light-regulated signal transduction histidine kinase (bacteriophytochrome)